MTKTTSGKMNELCIIRCELLPKCTQIHRTQTQRGRKPSTESSQRSGCELQITMQSPCKVRPKSAESPPEVRRKSARSPPKVRPKSAESPCKVRHKSAESPPEVLAKSAESPPEVLAKPAEVLAKSAEVRRVASVSVNSEVPWRSFALWGAWFALGGFLFSLFLFLWECEKKMLFVRLGEGKKIKMIV